MEFSDVWLAVQSRLHTGEKVRNWTAAKGFLGDDFLICCVDASHIEVDSPNAETIQRVSKKDFEVMYNNWTAYCSGGISRQALVKLTRVSKYTMSVLRHLGI